jgi:hypothetical protein
VKALLLLLGHEHRARAAELRQRLGHADNGDICAVALRQFRSLIECPVRAVGSVVCDENLHRFLLPRAFDASVALPTLSSIRGEPERRRCFSAAEAAPKAARRLTMPRMGRRRAR